jgi:hypothetical protein
MDLDQNSEMIILESILTTTEAPFFEEAGSEAKN